jgi:hypothetical protein
MSYKRVDSEQLNSLLKRGTVTLKMYQTTVRKIISFNKELSSFSIEPKRTDLILNDLLAEILNCEHTGWSKSHVTEKKWNISITARPNGLIFLPRIDTCSHSKSIRTRSVRSFVKYDYQPQQENFTFSQVVKKQYKGW